MFQISERLMLIDTTHPIFLKDFQVRVRFLITITGKKHKNLYDNREEKDLAKQSKKWGAHLEGKLGCDFT